MYFFEAENICKTYGNHVALDNVSLRIKEGTIYGLLGPNGAGKTSMIRIINKITGPDSGNLYWQGQPMEHHHVNEIGYLPEERGLYKKMKVGDHGIYLAQLKGISKHDAEKKLRQWFEKFEIQHWWNKRVEELSKGMQQKVQFILTVIHEPKMFIFDEPFSGFDPINTEMLKKEILEFKKKGASIILSTHNMSSVEELCDEMLLINNSRPILQGEVYEIKKEYKENIVEVHYTDCLMDLGEILPDEYEFMQIKNGSKTEVAQIQIPPDKTPNHLLQYIIPYCNIHSFFEVMPTLHDIFIMKVQAANFKAEHNTSVE